MVRFSKFIFLSIKTGFQTKLLLPALIRQFQAKNEKRKQQHVIYQFDNEILNEKKIINMFCTIFEFTHNFNK